MSPARHVHDTAGSMKTLLTAGHVAYCGVCDCRGPISNVRPWQDFQLQIGECDACGNTVTIERPFGETVKAFQRWKNAVLAEHDAPESRALTAARERQWDQAAEALLYAMEKGR